MNQEDCPLKKCQIVSRIFDHIGGKILIPQHAIKVMVPAGAIAEGHRVQIEAAASLFGPFIIPEDYDPIGAYLWIAAHYKFKKPLKIEIEHEVFVSENTNLSDLCVLTADRENYMHEDYCENHYSLKKSFCTIFASRFCSKCPAKKRKAHMPKRVIMYHYLPEDYKVVNEFVAEVSFCYDLLSCKKVCIFKVECMYKL